MERSDTRSLTELSNKFAITDINYIRNRIGFPDALYGDDTQSILFLSKLKDWSGHDPHRFCLALQHIRPDLVPLACEIPWLCVLQVGKLTIKTLLQSLKVEIPREQWKLIYISLSTEFCAKIDFTITMKMLLENGYVKKDLNTLSEIMKGIERSDLVEILNEYKITFSTMSDQEFLARILGEFEYEARKMYQWEYKLKQNAKKQFESVKQMIGTDKSVAKKEVEMSPVDFMKELKSYRNVEPEIWCVIGNLGCGKTFLAKRTALNLSNSQLVGILYTISIPCRNTDWHAMESTLNDPKAKVDSEFIQNWLCLGLQKGTEWSTDLSKHITVSSGEGLLLIIDGLDQFTKKVPFEKTFMFLLLKRTFLSKSTIILTCRPGAWIDISSHHELKIQRYYKVLGFSPENRDNYFEKQIGNGNKLVECRRILDRYYEINELSLIPVNASLFVSLLKGENSQSINTLTNLCTELTLYLIRRELSRMGLEAFSEVTNISQFYQDILECLSKIGLISYIGVAKQDPIFEERVPLFIDDIEYTSNCLGLIHEHYKEETNASIQKVWTFVNLTLQEFIAALWQSNTHWTDQCLSARFISHSNENFYLFKKVLRFLCGMLVDKSAAILTVLFYSFYRTEPKEMIDLPMTYQLKYEDLFSHTRYWNEFTEFYSALTEILFETNSHSISNWFKHFKQYLPYHLYIYILQTVSPNGWICFIQSLKIISQLELIHIDTEYIKQTQFEYLLENISLISVSYLSLVYKCKDSTVVLADLNLLREKIMKPEMKISIQLVGCDLKNVTEAIPFFPSVNHGLSCMRILNNINSKEFLLQLSQQLSGFHYLNFNEFKTNYDTLVPALCRATQLRGLQLYRIPAKYNKYLIAVLPQFTLLEEIRFDSYSLLPPICKLSNLRVLQIEERSQRSFTHIYYHLQQLMNRENNPLQVLVLYSLDKMSFSLFLECINKCTNLVQLKLCHYSIPLEDVVNFSFVNMLKSLVELIFFQVILYDQGFQALCNELTFHPTIRHFSAEYCAQTSLSCDPLIQLIYTLPNLETLHMTNLDEPDGEPIELLKKKCSGYSIECRFY